MLLKKLSRILRHHEFKNSPKRDPNGQDVKSPKAPSRDPKVQEIHAVQVTKRSMLSKSIPEKSSLLEAELFLVIAFPCIVKGPLLESMNPTL